MREEAVILMSSCTDNPVALVALLLGAWVLARFAFAVLSFAWTFFLRPAKNVKKVCAGVRE